MASPAHHPEDEPFDHEAISRHSRGESTANLLSHNYDGPSESDLNNTGDSFYDHSGPSRATLYDPEKSDPEAKQNEYARDRNYQDLGEASRIFFNIDSPSLF